MTAGEEDLPERRKVQQKDRQPDQHFDIHLGKYRPVISDDFMSV